MLWARGAAPEPGEQRMNVVPCPRGGRGNQLSGDVNPWSGHASMMVPRGKIPPEACAVLPRKCSHHSFPHKDHLVPWFPRRISSSAWYSQAESGKHDKYTYLFTFICIWAWSRDTLWLADESTSLEFLGILQDKCQISMENTLILSEEGPDSSSLPEKKWEEFWGSLLVSVPAQGTSRTWEMIILLYPPQIPNSKCFLSMPEYLAVALGWDSRQAWGNTLKQGEM